MKRYKFHNDCQSSVLTYEQVKRLDLVMNQVVPIHGRGNFPTLHVELKELIRLVRHKLQNEHSIEIRDVRLNGGASNFVLAPENSHYNDLDLVFGIDLSDETRFDVIRDVVLECLIEFYPTQQEDQDDCKRRWQYQHHHHNQHHHHHHNQQQPQQQQQQQQPLHQMPLNNCAIKEAYVHKMVKVNDDDRWSLISLGVQQSEANCCGQTSCLPSMATTMNPIDCSNCYEQQEKGTRQWQQFPVTLTANENEQPQQQQQQQNQKQHQSTNHQQSAQFENPSSASFIDTRGMQHQQVTYLYHRQHNDHYHQQKQFPNSIELKFVDRMRRKFEFSVDSFQIILDSLIQFYDYAPQSSTNSQWQFVNNSHPSSTMIITRPLIKNRRSYFAYCTAGCTMFENITIAKNHARNKLSSPSKDCHPDKSTASNGAANQPIRRNHLIKTNIEAGAATPEQSYVNGGSQTSYYQQPQLEPANSPPISSEASSSGCSSSSSVVSSSSSSLSCDEDHEDLYCDNYGSSPSSSSASSSSSSTSSLLGSTAVSILSSDGNVNELVSAGPTKTGSKSTNMLRNLKGKTTGEELIRNNMCDKLKGSATNPKAASTESASSKAILLDSNCRECIEGDQENSHNLLDDDFKMNKTSCAVISENFYPTVIGRSEYGDFKEALYHLEKKFIATRSPEEIRGGGLLKYCNLLVKNYKPFNSYQIRTLERYMCSRFFIDFSDLNQQQAKLESYLANHFSDDPALKFGYLTILHNVVQRSTVCLMNHELRLTMNMIRDLAFKLNEQQQHQHQQQQMQQQQQQQQQQQHQQQHHQQGQNEQSLVAQQHPYVQSTSQTQTQQQPQLQHFYHQQKPILVQSGVYRVKLVNYTLAKPIGSP